MRVAGPPVNGFFVGAEAHYADGVLKGSLRHGGADFLGTCPVAVTLRISILDEFGLEVHV